MATLYNHWIKSKADIKTISPLANQSRTELALRVRLVGRMEKWDDRKDLVFPHLCLVGRVEK